MKYGLPSVLDWCPKSHLCCTSAVLYVEPDSGNYCMSQDCHDLSYYATKFLASNSKLFFLTGRYILPSDFVLDRIFLISTIVDANSTPNTMHHSV